MLILYIQSLQKHRKISIDPSFFHSLNDCFIKAGRAANGKGHYWGIHEACIDDFRKGDYRRRRAQRKVRRHMGLAVDEEDSPSPPPPPPPVPVPGSLLPPGWPPLAAAFTLHQAMRPQMNHPHHHHHPRPPLPLRPPPPPMVKPTPSPITTTTKNNNKRLFDVASILGHHVANSASSNNSDEDESNSEAAEAAGKADKVDVVGVDEESKEEEEDDNTGGVVRLPFPIRQPPAGGANLPWPAGSSSSSSPPLLLSEAVPGTANADQMSPQEYLARYYQLVHQQRLQEAVVAAAAAENNGKEASAVTTAD